MAGMFSKKKGIQLGAKYRDCITGFTGVCTGHVEYLTGCNQTLLAPALGSDGALRDSSWFDDQRLEKVGDEVIQLDNSETPGCDKAAPVR